MREAAYEAGLDLCDVRMLYRDNRSSTPIRGRVCTSNNVDCWDSHELRYDALEPILCPDLAESPISTTMSTDLEASKESHPSIDLSYGGAWATSPTRQPQPQPQMNQESLPDLVDGLYNFGISVFDSTDEQVPNIVDWGGQKVQKIVPKLCRNLVKSNPPPPFVQKKKIILPPCQKMGMKLN